MDDFLRYTFEPGRLEPRAYGMKGHTTMWDLTFEGEHYELGLAHQDNKAKVLTVSLWTKKGRHVDLDYPDMTVKFDMVRLC